MKCFECHFFAVGDGAVHFYGGDVFTQGAELRPLQGRKLSVWEKNIHVNAFNAVETVGYGAAGMSGSGANHIDFAISLPCIVVRDEACHESRANVFKTHGRAMEKFEHMALATHIHQRDGKIECFEHHIVEHLGIDVALEGVVGDGVAHFLQRHIAKIADKRLRKCGNGFGKV